MATTDQTESIPCIAYALTPLLQHEQRQIGASFYLRCAVFTPPRVFHPWRPVCNGKSRQQALEMLALSICISVSASCSIKQQPQQSDGREGNANNPGAEALRDQWRTQLCPRLMPASTMTYG